TIPLPASAEPMIARIPPVRAVTAVRNVDDTTVRRSAAIAPVHTSGISVLAAEPSLLETLSARILRGRYLDTVAEHYPVTVLGHEAARILGIATLTEPTQVYLGNRYFTVVGILAPVPVAPEIDIAALIGFGVANQLFELGGRPSRIYLRVDPDQVAAVASVLPATASPSREGDVQVRRPSDILVARIRSEEHTSELQSLTNLVCRLLLENKK